MGILQKAVKGVNNFPDIENIGWHRADSGVTSTYDYYKAGDYENVYPSVSKIVNRFMVIAPYAIDEKKDVVENAKAVEKLYHPNQQMSSVDFREALAVMYLVHPRTHILVWRLENGVAMPGGQITPDNIAGYTFLENAVETTNKKQTTYTVNGQTYTDMEVITLKGMFPYNLARGFSPTEASHRWSTIDDYIADYQQGFFRNGAIPSGQFIITARTVAEYNDMVDMMQKRHRGAGKNNNVTYTHRPVDPNTSKPVDAQVEWTPFNLDNKDLDLKSIFDQVNQKLDSAFGVPASIRGVGENNNFATAQQDDRNFVQNIIDPLALKVWTRFTHEMNRITGGLGYAVTYDLKIPSVSEDEKVIAETHKIQSDTIINLIGAGFDVATAVQAIKAPDSFQSLVGKYTPHETATDHDVDTGNVQDDEPDALEVNGTTNYYRSAKAEEAKRKNPKAKQLNPANQVTWENQLAEVIRNHMQIQLDSAIERVKIGDATATQIANFTDDMLVVIVAGMVTSGQIEYLAGIQLLQNANIPTAGLSEFVLSDTQRQSYRAYLKNVADSYTSDTTKSIRNVLAQANEQGWNRSQTQSALQNIMNTDEWRVSRLSISEINRSQSMSSIYSMQQIQTEAGVKVEKTLQHTGTDTPCEYCQTFIGNWIPVDDLMIEKDSIIEGADGGLLQYTWDNNEGHDVHANGHCVPVYRVVR